MDSTQAPTKGGAPGGKTARDKGARAPKGARATKAARPAKAAKAPPTTRADEIIDALRAASRDKDIGFERLVAALEEAIATAARKVYKVREMAARFDVKTGTLTAWTPFRVVEQKTKVEPPPAPAEIDPDDIPIGQAAPPGPAAPVDLEPEKEIRLPYIELLQDEAHRLLEGDLAGQSWQVIRHPGGEGGPEEVLTPEQMEIGDEIRLYRSTEGLGRIAAQSAKQVLYQKVREAERENIYNEYSPKVGELITGTVKRFERGDMIVDLGRTEAVIPREHQSRAERYTQGERVRAVLADVHKNPKGAQLVLSRTAPELLMQLMRMEVPEIYDETVVIRGCVRQPGDRAKVAVSSRERDVDPVGACVGMRGARVQAIMRELRGERIDIIQYSDDLVTYAQNALAPAKITRVSVMPGEEDQEPEFGPDGEPLEPLPTLECIVEEEQLSLAIGKRGQNVRLAAALIGAKIEIKSEQAVKSEVAEALQRMLLSSQRRATPLAEVPGVDGAAADAFAAQGLATVGDVLEAASDADEAKAEALEAVALEPEPRIAVVEAVRDFDEAPPPEPEPEGEEESALEPGADAEAGTDQTEGREDAAEPASVAKTPEK